VPLPPQHTGILNLAEQSVLVIQYYSVNRNSFPPKAASLGRIHKTRLTATARSVICVYVCRAYGRGRRAVQKLVNRSRYRLGAASCQSKERCITWGSRSDETICSRKSAMRPSAKLLWTLVTPPLHIQHRSSRVSVNGITFQRELWWRQRQMSNFTTKMTRLASNRAETRAAIICTQCSVDCAAR